MSEQLSTQRAAPPRPGRALAGILIVALAGALVGVFAGTSFSQGFGPPWHMIVRGPMSGLTAEQIADRADRMVRHVAIEIDATSDQQAKLEAIVKGAVTDLVPMREKMFAARQPPRDLLTPTTLHPPPPHH